MSNYLEIRLPSDAEVDENYNGETIIRLHFVPVSSAAIMDALNTYDLDPMLQNYLLTSFHKTMQQQTILEAFKPIE